MLKLPIPKVIFMNKSTIVCNFIDITKKINSCDPLLLGNFIQNELGMKGVSINEKQLILKGRANENSIQKILTKYLLENVLCKSCLGSQTTIIKKSNCKFLHCEKCNHDSIINVGG
jgi:translation initiation factor 2 beta subunit (eIF-2beta)/eIF-5